VKIINLLNETIKNAFVFDPGDFNQESKGTVSYYPAA
jgi:hypothetical protein